MVNNLNLSTFFDDFEVKHLEIANSSEKQVSFKLRVVFSTNFWPKTKKIVRAVFEKNTKVSDFGLIWRLFREYLQIKNFFFKILALWLFYLCSPLTSFKKSEKSLAPFFEKTALTNYQPTNQLLPATTTLQELADAGPKNMLQNKNIVARYTFNKKN